VQAAKKLSGGGVGGGSVGGGSVGDGSVGGCVSPISPEPRSGNARNARNNARKRRNKELIQSKLLADIVDIRKGISETLNGAIPAIPAVPAVPAIPEIPSTPATTTVSDDVCVNELCSVCPAFPCLRFVDWYTFFIVIGPYHTSRLIACSVNIAVVFT
jgi:hypothetical protein